MSKTEELNTKRFLGDFFEASFEIYEHGDEQSPDYDLRITITDDNGGKVDFVAMDDELEELFLTIRNAIGEMNRLVAAMDAEQAEYEAACAGDQTETARDHRISGRLWSLAASLGCAAEHTRTSYRLTRFGVEAEVRLGHTGGRGYASDVEHKGCRQSKVRIVV